MPWAYRDAKGWTVEYRGLVRSATGKPERRRVPVARLTGSDPAALAKGYAIDCERACQRLHGPHTATDIHFALDLGAISPAQADALLAGLAPPTRAAVAPITLEAAFLAHPSTQHSTTDRRRYIGLLSLFQKWSGVVHLEDLTMAKVQDYVTWMRAQGYSWDYRRHCLLPLRRAARMAAARWQMADVLGEMVLDRRDRRAPVQAWTPAEIITACTTFKRSGNLRALVATGLGAWVGLRPSEIYRLQVQDLTADGRLRIGLDTGREAKNEPSRRILPLPPTVAAWWRELANSRPHGHYLIPCYGGRRAPPDRKPRQDRPRPRKDGPFTATTFSKWLQPLLAEATARRLPVKSLRKTWATWATRHKIDPDQREAWLGHDSPLAHSITAAHYVADLYDILADELTPIADRIEAELATFQTPTRSPTRKRKSLQ